MDVQVMTDRIFELTCRAVRTASKVFFSAANQRSTWLSHDAEVGVK
ncbi:hypothetical protein C7410_11570 [Paraburkholderia silvatlantica]|uniref:Uncharacterized protein n=1 Tax=Paraburkholderia silvatlantica TaxID=321895 RepID=A0A2V4UA30_9BURK|nr:hypothetical protein C7410_11570 [Paraburkholderia silvatlantica]TDQ86632.1 hypothetical protein C7412_117127 [Paraburkholderia silvatlantica]